MTARSKSSASPFGAILAIAATYCGALVWALSRGESPAEYIFVAAVFVAIFPIATWVATLGARSVRVERPASIAEMLVVLAIAALIALLLIPGPTQIARWIAPTTSPLVHELLVVAVKLAMFVALPGAVLAFVFKRGWRDLGVGGSRVSGLRAFLVFLVGAGLFTAVQFVFGRQGAEFKSGAYEAEVYAIVTPIVFIWMSIEAGLVEEFFFRAVLQERLAQVLRSPLAAALVGSLLFGLAHAPGLALRGESSWPEAILHSMLVLAPAGFAMAFLWMRTRNLILVALVHGAGDVIPHFAHIGEITGFLSPN